MIKDSFMNPGRFGFAEMRFTINGDKNSRDDIPQWRKNRSASRSMGKATYQHTKPCKCCGGLVRRVWNNECFDCWRLK